MAVKVVVDLDKCLGYANCVADAPEVFEIPEEAMIVRLLQDSPGEELRSAVEAAALDCPARAITVLD
jgi:ferredoxin